MNTIFTYKQGSGLHISIQGKDGGYSFILPESWSLTALANYVHELQEFLI